MANVTFKTTRVGVNPQVGASAVTADNEQLKGGKEVAPGKGFISENKPTAPKAAAANGFFTSREARTAAEYALMVMHDPARLAADFIEAIESGVLRNEFRNDKSEKAVC